MSAANSFNNVIIGQFALTGVPTKVYVQCRFLTITDPDDVENPLIGFGMDENGQMIQFDYINVERLNIAGNEVTLDTYNKGMEKKFGAGDDGGGEEEPEDEKAPEEEETKEGPPGMSDHYNPTKLKDLIKEISKDEYKAQVKALKGEMDAKKAGMKAAKEKLNNLKKQPIEDGKISEYTFGTGDIVQDINPKCPHYGSKGIVQKTIDMPDKGIVAIYTVTNNGKTFKSGDKLAKTVDQLEKI